MGQFNMELELKLKAIAQAIEKAKGDPKKEIQLLEALQDPAEANACEGCQ